MCPHRTLCTLFMTPATLEISGFLAYLPHWAVIGTDNISPVSVWWLQVFGKVTILNAC